MSYNLTDMALKLKKNVLILCGFQILRKLIIHVYAKNTIVIPLKLIVLVTT